MVALGKLSFWHGLCVSGPEIGLDVGPGWDHVSRVMLAQQHEHNVLMTLRHTNTCVCAHRT